MRDILDQTFGWVSSGIHIGFSSTAISASLEAQTMYRVISDENCHIKFTTLSGHLATTDDAYLPTSMPEMFSTGDPEQGPYWISVIRVDTNGNLFCTKMKTGASYPDRT